MHNAQLYESSSDFPNTASKQMIDAFKHNIQWRKDGRDKVLDVGCGTANALMKYIYPLLPASFEAIVGIDISEEMIRFSSEKYQNYKNCNFIVLDITTKKLPAELCGQFDHVTSFFALQWMHDQKTTLANIHKLLRNEGGDCLFLILISTPIYDIYLIMQKSSKWAPHMTNIHTHIAHLYYSKDPLGDYRQLLTEAGFTDSQLEVRHNIFEFKSAQQIKDLVKSVCPLLERMSAELQEEFLNDFLHIVENSDFCKSSPESAKSNLIFHYKLLAVYARKPSELCTAHMIS